MLSCGGTLHTARLALEHGRAGHLGGGFHHAYADHGEGFCMLNDVAVTARVLVEEGSVERVAVVDGAVFSGQDASGEVGGHVSLSGRAGQAAADHAGAHVDVPQAPDRRR